MEKRFNQKPYDCGNKVPVEGCHCKKGYLVDNSGNCILPENCGCQMPESNVILDVNN